MADRRELANEQFQNDLDLIKRQLAEQSYRISELERLRHQQRSVTEKFRPTLWEYRQYPPRTLQVPSDYENQQYPRPAPTIAIVTPSFNSAQFLAQTVDSVVNQGYPQLAYAVQDGGSTDGTKELLAAKDSRLSWRSEPDAGQADAINRGFNAISGDIMGYLNSDDLLLPGTLAYIANEFARRPDVDILYGNRITIDNLGSEIGRIVLPPHDSKALRWLDFIPQETMFWRKQVWDKIGPLDNNFRFAMDWDFILRAQRAGFKFRRTPRFLACFRIHMGQKTVTMTSIGHDEQQRLRQTHLGYLPSKRHIRRHCMLYLWKQVLFQRLYKSGFIKI